MHNKLKEFGVVKLDRSFKHLTTIKVGGEISIYFEPYDIYNLVLAIRLLKSNNYKYKIIGNGSNLLASDKQYDGVIIKLKHLNHYELNDNELYAEAGVPIIVLANFAINNGYSGLEFASGIPALLGGIIYMNASAYNEAISDVISEVLIYKDDKLVWMKKEELNFAYRTSIFQDKNDWIIIAVKLNLTYSNKKELKRLSIDRNQRRFKTQPINYPNCGSVFRNLSDYPAWKVIDDLNLRGRIKGGAMISDKHSNFICNIDNASALDVNTLIEEIMLRSKNEKNIDLLLEVEKFNW